MSVLVVGEAEVYKFEQVFSDGHQIALAWGRLGPRLGWLMNLNLKPYLHTWLSLRYLCAARGSVPRQSASRRASPPLLAPHSVPCWRQRRTASGRRDVHVRRTCKHPLQSVLPSRVISDINNTNRRRLQNLSFMNGQCSQQMNSFTNSGCFLFKYLMVLFLFLFL